jgi:succinoglycan biosynthesis protein ExoL
MILTSGFMEFSQQGERVVYLIPDDDTTGRKRIDQFRKAGSEIATFAFRRNHGKAYAMPTDQSVRLIGLLPKRRYFGRVPALVAAFFRLLAHRREFRSATLVIARNLDLLLLALTVKVVTGSRAPIVYEVHDIPRPIQGDGARARLLRAIEGAALKHVAFMALTSQAFVDNYYKRYYRFSTPYQILENKIYLDSFFRDAPEKVVQWTSQGRTKIGFDPSRIHLSWVGGIRCITSATILREIARRFPARLGIHLYGRANFCTESELRDFFSETPNVTYHGTFKYPDDLADIYKLSDLNWCFDLTDAGQNTKWLLPNRIYEGGYFGVPCLGERQTATGQYIESAGVGWTFSRDDLLEEISRFFAALDSAIYDPVKKHCVQLMDLQRDSHLGVAAILERAAIAA